MNNGIYGKSYIDIVKHIDIDSFDKLHPEICSGFVSAQHEIKYGYLDLYEPNKPFVNLDTYDTSLKPVWYFYDKYKTLPDAHPIKVAGTRFTTENDLIHYITYVYGAHNPYKIYEIYNHEINIESVYFLGVINWIKDVKIFSKITSAYFLIVEGGGTSIEHCDPEFDGDTSLHEFIYVRHDLNRKFYVKNSKTDKKVYINTRAVCFNDQDYHGSDPCNQATYMLRIDGIFTDAFKITLMNDV